MIKEWFKENNDTTNSCMVNCKYNNRFTKWEVLTIDNDKTIPTELEIIKKLEN